MGAGRPVIAAVILRVIARTTMPAPPAVQRKPVRRAAVISVLAILTITVAALAVLRMLLRLRLAAGDERRQALDVVVLRTVMLAAMLGARLEWLRLRLMLRLLLLRLILLRLMILFARIERLLLARCERLTGHLRLIVVAIVIAVVLHRPARLLLIIRLGLTQLFLRGGDQAEIVFGVLVVIFRGNRVAGTLGVARELQIFLRDMRSGAADFYILSVGLIDPREGVLMMMMAALAIASTHTLVVLTVSHGSLFHQPLNRGGRSTAIFC